MSIFNFSNLIKPENSGNPAKTEATKLRASEPSFKALVQKIVDEKHAASQNSAPTPEPVSVPTPVEIPVEQKPVPVEVKEEEVTVKQENLPAIPEDVTDQELEPAILPTKEIKSEVRLTENQTYGTFYLKSILTEFSDILSAGKDLEELETEKKNVGSEGEELESKKSIGKEARQKVANSLSDLLNNETDSPDLLNTALNSYQEYLTAFESRYEKLIREKRIKNNDLIVKINNKKEQIKKLINQEVGGTQNFQKIKEIVSFCKKQREKALDAVENVNEFMKNEIVESVNKFVEGDLHGAVMLAESGDLIGLMMRIYNAPQK